MLNRLRSLWLSYPRQFWLLFAGLLISIIGASMIWPFLMIYVSERLQLPLTTVASLMTLNSGLGLAASFIAGPITDRAGRKWVMAVSLVVNGLAYFWMSQANTFLEFALIMGLSGAFNPLYRVGADAMLADLVSVEKRADAYSLLRTSNNLGVALGPAIGGLVASQSYAIAFYCAAIGMGTYGLLIAFFASETLPQRTVGAPAVRERFGGYARVFQDHQFTNFVAAFTLTQVCAAMIWVLMAVYAKQNYQVPESQYGFIATTNALMVVLFQYGMTQLTKKRPPMVMLALGSFLYTLAVGSVAWMTGFWGFWISMVILTVGELILSPTATTLAANLAPADMRGRYMSLYNLTWSVAAGLGPVYGGFLNDRLSPQAAWYGGALVGALGTLVFIRLMRRYPQPVAVPGATD